MKLAIMQPTFNPWLGYFDLIDFADEFIFLDTVQLTKRSWQTRNRLIVNSKEYIFSIPVYKTSSRSNLLIKDAKISFEHFDFRKKLYNFLLQEYKKSQYFQQVDGFIKNLIFADIDLLSEYNINIIQNISRKIGIKTNFDILSKYNLDLNSKKANLIFDICQYFHASIYVSPIGSYAYLQTLNEPFKKANISIKYQIYKHPIYNQSLKEFIPYIGIFDILYNNGFDNALKIIRQGRDYKIGNILYSHHR